MAVYPVPMRFINLSLIGYCLLVAGFTVCLWQIGALRNITPFWIAVAALATAALGTAISGKPIVEEIQP